MKRRTRAFPGSAPCAGPTGPTGHLSAARIAELSKGAIPNAVRILLTWPQDKQVRCLALQPDNVRRAQMLCEVQTQAGPELRHQLRAATFALMQGQVVPA